MGKLARTGLLFGKKVDAVHLEDSSAEPPSGAPSAEASQPSTEPNEKKRRNTKSAPETVRISNLNHIACLPFRLLEDVISFRYEEATPTENARKLHEGEVDVAIIPLVEFLTHGGYQSLEFGMACHNRSDSMVLYANEPVEELHTIHVYESSRSSMMLLQLLLKEKWDNPDVRIMRRKRNDILDCMRYREGVLLNHDLPGLVKSHLPTAIDLATAWHEHTGLPFVFLVWAVRPDAIDETGLKALISWMHKCAHARHSLSKHLAGEYGALPDLAANFVSEIREYYLDEDLLVGLEEFRRRAIAHNLIPETPYKKTAMTIIKSSSSHRDPTRPLRETLAAVAANERISIAEAANLAEEAAISELRLAVDMARRERRGSRIGQKITPNSEHAPTPICMNIAELTEEAANRGCSVSETIRQIRRRGPLEIESVYGHMLLDRKLIKIDEKRLTAREWLEGMRAVHLEGLKTECGWHEALI